MVEDGGVETVDRVEQPPQWGSCRGRKSGAFPAGPACRRMGNGVPRSSESVGVGVSRSRLFGGVFRGGAQVWLWRLHLAPPGRLELAPPASDVAV
jgi:hypothetical protein